MTVSAFYGWFAVGLLAFAAAVWRIYGLGALPYCAPLAMLAPAGAVMLVRRAAKNSGAVLVDLGRDPRARSAAAKAVYMFAIGLAMSVPAYYLTAERDPLVYLPISIFGTLALDSLRYRNVRRQLTEKGALGAEGLVLWRPVRSCKLHAQGTLQIHVQHWTRFVRLEWALPPGSLSKVTQTLSERLPARRRAAL